MSRQDGTRGLLMKRIQYHHYGRPEELRLEEAKQPDLERGQFRYGSGLQQLTRWTGKFAGAK